MKQYWIMKLRFPRLLGLLLRGNREGVLSVTYLDSTAPARVLLKLAGKRELPFSLHKIEPHHSPSGPRLNLSQVRNDKGQVILFDAFHQVLRIRSRAREEFLADYKNFAFLRESRHMNMLAAYFGLKIAEEITAVVFIANYARWKNHQKNAQQGIENILVIPGDRWSDLLSRNLAPLVARVVVGKKERMQGFRSIVRVLKSIASGLVKTRFRVLFPIAPAQAANPGHPGASAGKEAKIMATYAMGVFADKRNDISYIHAAGIDPSRLVLYFKYNDHRPSAEEIAWINKNNITCFSGPTMREPIPGVPKPRRSKGYQIHLTRFFRMYLTTIAHCISGKAGRRGDKTWPLLRLWELGVQTAEWQDFYSAQNIRVIMHQVPGAGNFIPNYAIARADGISGIMERSILFDYCTYIHNSPNHVNFVTGPYSLTQIPEPSFSSCTVQIGALGVRDTFTVVEGIEELRKNCSVVVTVFDEMPNSWFFGKSVEQMYLALIELVEKDERFGLLIKTKKPQVLQQLPEVEKAVNDLVEKGKCLLADWKVTSQDAAANSDMVVCVPSTVAFESILTKPASDTKSGVSAQCSSPGTDSPSHGVRTLLFNPMRSGSLSFYKANGLNRRIFEDAESMLKAIKNYADGKDDTIGDCSDLAQQVDPFRDGLGSERLGRYLLWCLEGFDSGKSSEETMDAANEKYRQLYGEERLTKDNAYAPAGG